MTGVASISDELTSATALYCAAIYLLQRNKIIEQIGCDREHPSPNAVVFLYHQACEYPTRQWSTSPPITPSFLLAYTRNAPAR